METIFINGVHGIPVLFQMKAVEKYGSQKILGRKLKGEEELGFQALKRLIKNYQIKELSTSVCVCFDFLFMAVKVKESLCNTLSTFSSQSFRKVEYCCGKRNVNITFAGHYRVAALSRSNQEEKQQLQACKSLKHDSIQRSSVWSAKLWENGCLLWEMLICKLNLL